MPFRLLKRINSRRRFLKDSTTALAIWPFLPGNPAFYSNFDDLLNFPAMKSNDPTQNMIGLYGPWAASLVPDPPALSFRNPEWKKRKKWHKKALKKTEACLSAPDIGTNPEVTIHRKYEYDGLEIEELSWQLPYGRPTQAILLKPAGTKSPLPAILGLHDHGGNKYFGRRKITKTGDSPHPMMDVHQAEYYEGKAWANEIAKRGYVVLVHDSFTFGSRRVWYQDAGGFAWGPLKTEEKSDAEPEREENIHAYNDWASEHEHIMAKSLFCAGTTWPGVFLREDQRALDILAARPEVDASRIGCCGLSGGGLRTAYLGGLDPRIQCAVSVGFMSTWRDFLLHKCFTHTWMIYIPLLPNLPGFSGNLWSCGLRFPPWC